MRIDKERIVSEFNMKNFGAKGWMSSGELKCPICGRNDKFGVLFIDDGGVTHCFYNCGENLSIFTYLRQIGRDDLIEYEYTVEINKLKKPKFLQEDEEFIEKHIVSLPVGYKRIYFDSYLLNRNFKSHQYEQFEVGITEHFLERRLKNYLIFVLRQKGEIVGWLARSKHSKKWHQNNLEQAKQGKTRLCLRYENSERTDFTKILGGFDEITENTKTVILVEGLFDKTNVSNLLETEKREELKVCFTFGNKVSIEQIELLQETNVEEIILMYDHGTVKQSKEYAGELFKYFNVWVCDLPLEINEKGEEVDPGNADINFIRKVLSNNKNFIYFYTSKLNFKNFN